MFSLELKYQVVAKYSDPEQIIIFILFTLPEFPCLNSKEEDPNLGLDVCLFVCFTLQSKWFTFLLGITELLKEHDTKLLGKREDAEEDSKYLVRGGKG